MRIIDAEKLKDDFGDQDKAIRVGEVKDIIDKQPTVTKMGLAYLRNTSWEGYGIDKAHKRRLKEQCKDPRNKEVVEWAANRVEPDLAKWLALSATEGLSYTQMFVTQPDRAPTCETVFYGALRYMYYLVSEKLKERAECEK